MKSVVLLLIALVQIIAVSASTQIDYFRDQSCSSNNRLFSLPVTDNFINTCFNYEYSGAGSFGLSACSEYSKPGSNTSCKCIFYVNSNCSGKSASVIYGGSNCANTATTLLEPKSVFCYYVIWSH